MDDETGGSRNRRLRHRSRARDPIPQTVHLRPTRPDLPRARHSRDQHLLHLHHQARCRHQPGPQRPIRRIARHQHALHEPRPHPAWRRNHLGAANLSANHRSCPLLRETHGQNPLPLNGFTRIPSEPDPNAVHQRSDHMP